MFLKPCWGVVRARVQMKVRSGAERETLVDRCEGGVVAVGKWRKRYCCYGFQLPVDYDHKVWPSFEKLVAYPPHVLIDAT